MGFPVRTPSLLMRLFPARLWAMDRGEKAIYLTFDDGPTPGVTDQVLDLLAIHGAKATFFCIGKNARAHPDLLRRIVAEGHTLGNHTDHHENGWRTSLRPYLDSVAAAQATLATLGGHAPHYFRPPYGRITARQARRLPKGMQIVMWDTMPGDFIQEKPVAAVRDGILKHARNGAIVVLHDSVKAAPRMLPALQATLMVLEAKGYAFKALP